MNYQCSENKGADQLRSLFFCVLLKIINNFCFFLNSKIMQEDMQKIHKCACMYTNLIFIEMWHTSYKLNLHDWDTKLVSSYPFCRFRRSLSYVLFKYKEHIGKQSGLVFGFDINCSIKINVVEAM